MIDLNLAQALLMQRSRETFPECNSWTSSDWMLELFGELGETANLIKKINRGDQDPILRLKLEEEFADSFICFLLNAEHNNIDLEKIALVKSTQDSIKRHSDITLNPATINDVKILGFTLHQIHTILRKFSITFGISINLMGDLSPEEIQNL